jgi:simple sugar transport system ATP-binding protein
VTTHFYGARNCALLRDTQSGIVLRYVLQARDLGNAVIFITHNPHHAFPVGDRLIIMKRGRLMGSHLKSETSIEQLTELMAGGAELRELSHELESLQAGGAVAEAARLLAAEASVTLDGGEGTDLP